VPQYENTAFWKRGFENDLNDLKKRFFELGFPFIPLHEKSSGHIHGRWLGTFLTLSARQYASLPSLDSPNISSQP
jgi:hypothetical protein